MIMTATLPRVFYKPFPIRQCFRNAVWDKH